MTASFRPRLPRISPRAQAALLSNGLVIDIEAWNELLRKKLVRFDHVATPLGHLLRRRLQKARSPR